MRNAFIIHGAYGNPQENWFPWLRERLIENGYSVEVPEFPTPLGQSLARWFDVFREYEDMLNEDTIMVGHSLGCPFILRILESIDNRINSVYLVSAFHTLLNKPIDEINHTFVEDVFDWGRIRQNSSKIVMLSSDNDHYISQEISDELAALLKADYEIIQGGGHLNATAGYTKFDRLLQKIKE